MMQEFATPCLLIAAEIARRNIRRLAEYGRRHGIGIRPHTKTHKSLRLAQMQLEAGASGLTVAKVGEAEVMTCVGDDLLIAYPTVDPPRTRRVAHLARHTAVRVAVDSSTAAAALADAARANATTVGILVDLDVGVHRTGLGTPAETLSLAQYVDSATGLRLDGLFCYPGHIWDPPNRQEAAMREVGARISAVLDLWWQHGLQAKVISSGSTPTAYQSHLIPGVTEIRPGTYVLNDMNTVHGRFCTLDDCAARILCTVVSDAVKGQVVIDAGSKTLTSDLCVPAPESGHGYVVEYPKARITRLTEEHGQIDITQCETAPRVGDRVTVIPNHICPCVNLQDSMWWQESGLDPVSIPVEARGKLS